jgi:PncC family amidohydrolase
MPPDPEVFVVAKRVGEGLRRAGKTVAVAESCTGGLLGAALTDVPGSSAYFLGGVIAYADQVKLAQLGVSPQVLQREGAVSAAAAAAMAEGVRRLLDADIGVSITGVAGPDAEESKPVGLTFIGVAAPGAQTHRYYWTGDRWDNRRNSVMAALELLAQAVEPERVY